MSSASPRARLLRLAAASAGFAWLVVPAQFFLVNFEGFSPLLFLWMAVGGFLVWAGAGALFGLLLGGLAGRLPFALLAVAAGLLPAAGEFLLYQARILFSSTFANRAAVVSDGTRLAYLVAAGGFAVALLLGRRLRAPLPATAALAGSFLALGLLAGEPRVLRRGRAEVEASLSPGAPAARRLLVFGADGLDWSVIDDLAARGELPHFQALRQRGAWAPYKTMEPTLSPIIWNTMATGVGWEEHGVREFVYVAFPGAARDGALSGTFLQPLLRRIGREDSFLRPWLRLAGSSHRRRLAFWQVLEEAGQPVAVVNWWATQPPGPTGGVLISDQAVEQGLQIAARRDAGDPEGRHQAALEAFVEAAVEPDTAAVFLLDELRPARLQAHFAEARGLLAGADFGLESGLPEKQVTRFARALIHGAVTERLLREDGQPVCVFYERITDQISHLYWQFYRPGEAIYGERAPSARAIVGLKDMVPAAYRTADRILGRLLAAAGSDADVLVVSDHGFSAIRPPARYEWGRSDKNPPRSGHHHHGEPGVFLLAGPGVCPGRLKTQVSILDFFPTVLHLRGLPVASNLAGRVVEEALCDPWRKEHPVRAVPTFEFPEWRRDLRAAKAAAENIQDLNELGYL